LINQILTHISDERFLDIFVTSLYGKQISAEYFEAMKRTYETPCSYSEAWEYRGFWDNYEVLNKRQYLRTFHN